MSLTELVFGSAADFESDSISPPEGFVDDDWADAPRPDEGKELFICNAPGCGKEIAWAGRGRKPLWCQDHRRDKRPSHRQRQRTRTNPRAGLEAEERIAEPVRSAKAVDRRIQGITDDLMIGAGKLAGTLTPIAPVTGIAIAQQAPDAINALLRIAENYPKMMDGIEVAAKVVPFIEVGKFVSALMLAVMVDLGQADPYGVAGRWLNVDQAAAEAGWKPKQPEPERVVEGFVVPQPAGANNRPPEFNL